MTSQKERPIVNKRPRNIKEAGVGKIINSLQC